MRKNFFRTLIAGVAMACVMSVPAYAESGTVIGDYVNIRTGPGTGYGVAECLRRGEQLTVTDRSNSSWYAVEYNGITGFMASGYISVDEQEVYVETPVYTGSSEGSDAYVNAMYVRFRSGPGSEYSILDEYNKGKAVSLLGSYGEWYACRIDGQDGYIHSAYITEGTYTAPRYDYSASGDIYLDSYIPSTDEEYLVAVPTERPVATPVPVHTPVPVPTEIPVATPAPVYTPVPVQTEIPVATETPVETPAPTPVQPETQEQARGFINANYVRFRTGPSTGYGIIDSYNRGTSLTITGTVGEWTACEINGISGYVFTQYVTRTSEAAVRPPETEPEQEEIPVATPAPTEAPVPTPTPIPVEEVEHTEGYVSGNSVRMRSGPSMSSDIITELNFGNRVTITGTSGDWTAVIYEGESGFIYSQYVQEGQYSIPVQPDAPEWEDAETDSSELGRQIADYALQFVGYNYTWGGMDPSTGFDCSGLVYYVYRQFGYTLNRVADDQANNGVHVDQLQPGDILCFYSGSSYIGHVGIYIGDGMFVHAQNSATGVVITSLNGYYGERGYEARRIV